MGPTRRKRRRLLAALAVPVLVSLGFVILSLSSCRAPDLGLVDGKLMPCPSSPNCVCSQDPDEDHRIDPLSFDVEASVAWAVLLEEIDGRARTEVIEKGDGYVRVAFRSLVFRFVDDVEFLLDAKQSVIHVRSASRVGYSDLGANRSRVESLREALREALETTSENDEISRDEDPGNGSATQFDELRWQSRVICLFASTADDARIETAIGLARTRRTELVERDLVMIIVSEEQVELLELEDVANPSTMFIQSSASYLRDRFGVGADEFVALLVGKDGGEKARALEVPPLDEWFALVDAMPMRRREVDERR